MAVYTISQASIAARSRKIRIWAVKIIVPSLLLLMYFRIFHSSIFGRNLALVDAISFALLAELIRPFLGRRFSRKRSAISGDYRIEVTPDAVELRSAFFSKRIAREEIVRAEEPSWGFGLYLRTSNPFRWILVPQRIDGFEELRSGLAASGLPIVQTLIPSNWESFVFPVLFCGSLLCDMFAFSDTFAISRFVLILNLGVALLIGISGYFFAISVENQRMRLKVRLGSLIPLVGAALALLFQTGHF
jgi:hypothetical protein